MKFKIININKNEYILYSNGTIFSNNKQRFLEQFNNGKGYLGINMWNGSSCVREYIHRLLAYYFIPNPLNKKEVNHIDGNKQNNSLDNLEWVTKQENMNHAWSTGLFASIDKTRKENQQSWLGQRNSSRTIIGLTDIKNKSGNYKILIKCNCSNEFLMYFNDFKKDKQTYCRKCRPKSSYS